VAVGLHRGISYWEISKVQDVLLVLSALIVIGVAAAAFVWPGVGLLRLASIAVTAGLIDFLFPQAVELVSSDFPGTDSDQPGEIVALFATGMLVGSLVLRLVDLAPPAGGLPLLAVIGLGVFALVGLVQPVVELLPIEGSTSVWETFTAADVLRALIGLATVGMALAAILLPRYVGLTGAAFALGCYTATDNVVSSVEALAADANGAEPFVSLLLLAPLGIAAAALVTVGARGAFRPS
jgi:hypothetical protein